MAIYGGPDIVTDGLVLHLDAANDKSYSGSGNVWYDLKNSYDATVAGGSPTYRSINGGVFEFDGIDDYMLIPDPGSLSNFTISCWVYPLLSSSGAEPCIISSVYPPKVNFMISYLNDHRVLCGIYNAGWTSFSRVYSSAGWQNLVVTYNGSQMLLYRNTSVIRTENTTKIAESSNLGIRIGRRWDAAHYFNGYISCINIYNQSLSSNLIASNYNALKGRFGL
jgi:hypothetical protein